MDRKEIQKLVMGSISLETWKEKALWEECKRRRVLIEQMIGAGLNIQHMLVPESKEDEKLIDIFLKSLEQ